MAGKALLPLLGSQLLFGKQRRLVEKDLKQARTQQQNPIRMELSALGKELFILR